MDIKVKVRVNLLFSQAAMFPLRPAHLGTPPAHHRETPCASAWIRFSLGIRGTSKHAFSQQLSGRGIRTSTRELPGSGREGAALLDPEDGGRP